jgi:hypothetical protein
LVLSLLLVPTVSLVTAMPAAAHHSFAGYDLTQTLSGKGTIKEFRWGAPHSMGVFVVKDKDGKEVALTLASSTPTNFVRQGFNPKDFKVGEKVELTWHPSKSGATGGLMSSMKLPDGRIFNEKEYVQAGDQVEVVPPSEK